MRSTGSDLNSGSFDSTAVGTGTDYSQSDTPHVTFNGTTITATTTGVSASIVISGYTVATTDTGNTLRIDGGVNFTTGLYAISSVNVGLNTWILDRVATTAAASGMTGRMGSSLLSLGPIGADKGFATLGWIVYIKSGTYVMGNVSNVSGGRLVDNSTGTVTQPNRYIGYQTTHGDLVLSAKPRLQANNSSMTLIIANGGHCFFDNLEFFRDAAGGLTNVVGLELAGSADYVARCLFSNLNSANDLNMDTIDCEATQCEFNNCTSGAVITARGCGIFWSTGHDGAGAFASAGTQVAAKISRCLAFNITGDAFSIGADGTIVENCTSYNCSGPHGGFYSTAGSNKQYINCLSYLNTNFPFTDAGESFLTNCAGDAASTGFQAGNVAGYVTLTANPFTNTGGLDFSLNNTPGGGTACRGAGVPGLFPGSNSTGAPNIGAVQSAVPVAVAVPHQYHLGRRTIG